MLSLTLNSHWSDGIHNYLALSLSSNVANEITTYFYIYNKSAVWECIILPIHNRPAHFILHNDWLSWCIVTHWNLLKCMRRPLFIFGFVLENDTSTIPSAGLMNIFRSALCSFYWVNIPMVLCCSGLHIIWLLPQQAKSIILGIFKQKINTNTIINVFHILSCVMTITPIAITH